MTLKERVQKELKRKKRSSSWLAGEIGMSVDGLRLALIKESLKYADMVVLCKVLEIKGGVLFGEGSDSGGLKQVQDDDAHRHDEVATSRNAPRNDDRDIVELLKEQIRDKEKIIELMNK